MGGTPTERPRRHPDLPAPSKTTSAHLHPPHFTHKTARCDESLRGGKQRRPRRAIPARDQYTRRVRAGGRKGAISRRTQRAHSELLKELGVVKGSGTKDLSKVI